MPGNLTLDQLKAAVKAGEIDTVIAAGIDMQGRLMGKRFHAQFFVDGGWEETHCCNYLLTVDMEMTTVQGYKSTSWETGYGDYVLKPDLATLRRIPWLPGTALVLGDTQDHATHADVPHAPRSILKRQVERARAMGFEPMMATELEFYLFENSYENLRDGGLNALQTVGGYNEDYHIFQTTKEEDVMRAVRNGLYGAGIPVENTKGEAEAGQEEVNYKYSDALDTADNHVIIKNAIKEIAWSKGKSVTFMAKYDHRRAGSSSHIHQSLWSKDGKPSFADKADGHGMSEVMKHYLAGQLHHARDITAFLAPYVNSYKRFCVGMFAGVERGQPHGRFPRLRRAYESRAGGMPGSRVGREPLSGLRGPAGGGPGRDREEDGAGAGNARRHVQHEGHPRDPAYLARGGGPDERLADAARGLWR